MQHSMHWQDFHTEPVQSPGNMQYVPLPYHVMVPVGESGMMPPGSRAVLFTYSAFSPFGSGTTALHCFYCQ
jgi:hypothetical protein